MNRDRAPVRSRRVIHALLLSAAVVLVPDPGSADSVGAGASHSAVVKTSDNTAWSWGLNTNGRLGDGTSTQRTTPVQVGVTGNWLTGVTMVSAGTAHTLALKSDGSVWAWGLNTSGQVGDNTTVTQRLTPVPVVGITGSVVGIAAGDNHSLAWTSDGKLYAWGLNSNGQLGLGDTTLRRQATQVTLGGNPQLTVSHAAAGAAHSLAVTSDTAAWAWGSAGSGRLGNGAASGNQSLPVQVLDSPPPSGLPLMGFSKVAAGSIHSLAIMTNGTATAWGSNGNGRLGDGSLTQRTTPVPVHVLSSVIAISTGKSHSVAVESDGTVHAWGLNSSGQLGNGGATSQELEPILVSGISNVISVVAAADHNVAVGADGVVWAWGYNNSGQIGDGTNGTANNRKSPVAISGPGFEWRVATPHISINSNTYNVPQNPVITCASSGVIIRYTLDGNDPDPSSPQVAHGGTVNVAVSATLKVKAWKGTQPESNVNSRVYELQVVQPTFTPPGNATYTQPQNVQMATTTTGAFITYTSDGVTEPTETSTPYTAPVNIASKTTLKAKAFKTGWTASTTRTAIFSFNYGTLAPPALTPPAGNYVSSVTVTMSAMPGATIRYTTNGSNPNCTSSSVYPPAGVLVEVTTTLKALACHPDYTQSTITTGAYMIEVATPIFSPGAGSYPGGTAITISDATAGAAIHYTTNGVDPTQSDPQIVSGSSIAVGNYTLKARGFKNGCTTSAVQTATYTATSTSWPPPVLAGGYGHSVALAPDATVWAWGDNYYGQVGDGSSSNTKPSPVHLANANLTGIVAVAAGYRHSVALRGDGTVWAWGYNLYGQLGNNSTANSASAVQVKVDASNFLTGVTAIAAARHHCLALKSNGTVWAWGMNDHGQLGNNSTTSSSVAVQVLNITDAIAIAAGGADTNFGGYWRGAGSHSLALKSNGTVLTWGGNQHGQLGDNTTTNRLTPVAVGGGLSSVIAIGAGGYHSLAVKTDGTVWAWGASYLGQLGNGTSLTPEIKLPVRATGLTGAIAVRGGGWFSLALKVDGTLWSWGSSGYGQLGDGTTTLRTTPAQMPSPSGVIAAAAGEKHGLARTASDSVWAWGYNYWGQVGDGTEETRYNPVQVFGPGFGGIVATPLLSPTGEPYPSYNDFSVSVSTITPNATIHFTTNGDEPTELDPEVIGGYVLINKALTLKAKAWAPGLIASDVASSTYLMAVYPPTLTPNTGTYPVGQAVTIEPAIVTSGAKFHYTTDGNPPTESDPWVPAGGQVLINAPLTLKVQGYRTYFTPSNVITATYTTIVQTPQFSPGPGSYIPGQQVTITCPAADATIHYTDGGLEPTELDPVIVSGGSVILTKSVALKAKAWKSGWAASETGTASYMVTVGTVAAPTFSPPPGTYSGPQPVSLSTTTPGGTIRYTTDGSNPTLTSTRYVKAIQLERSQTLKARAFHWDWTPSSTAIGAYTINVSTVAIPVFDVPPGSYTAARYVPISCATPGATIRYTTSGLDPTTGDAQVPPGGVFVDKAMRLKAKAWKSGLPDSPVAAGDYALTGMIAAGGDHSLAVKSDGTVWSWGSNSIGQLGKGTQGGVQLNAATIPGGFSGVVAVAAGHEHSLALKADGTVWAWGGNGYGALGTGDLNYQTSPVQVGAGLTNVVAIAATEYGSLALRNDGVVYAFGRYTQNTPSSIPGLVDIVAISAGSGGSYSTAVKKDGTVWVWDTSPTPAQVPGLTGVVASATGTGHRLALKTDGTISGLPWSWGNNANGQLGNNSRSAGSSPAPVSNLNNVVSVAAGKEHSLALEDDAALWSWGDDAEGQLGDVPWSDRLVPLRIVSLTDVVVVGGGSWHSLAVKGDGTLWAWGNNGSGALGDGTNTDSPIPVQVQGLNLADTSWLYGDPDSDGLLTGRELALGSDPFLADSNGDGVPDGVALAAGLSLTDMDMDDDGVLNPAELQAGTNPFVADTDADGCLDNVDAFPLDPTRCNAPPPDPGDTIPPVISLTEPTDATLISVVPPQ